MTIRAMAAFIVLLFTANAHAEMVDVKYRGAVDLKTFECRDVNRSSFIQRVCYDKAQSYMIINLRGTNYHYCELPAATFDGLMGASSMGQYYNLNIKGGGSDGPFDCRTHKVPQYSQLSPNEPQAAQSLQKAFGTYSRELDARSRRMFPWASQEQERQLWIADQEQQDIANGINRAELLEELQRRPQHRLGEYRPELEARSHQMFPWMSQERERQQWMADQERGAISQR